MQIHDDLVKNAVGMTVFAGPKRIRRYIATRTYIAPVTTVQANATGAIVGSVLGGIAGLVLLVAIAVFIRKAKSKLAQVEPEVVVHECLTSLVSERVMNAL